MPVPRTTRSALALGDETAWGTAVAPDRFYNTPDGALDFKTVTGRGKNASASEGVQMALGLVPGATHVEGRATVLMDYAQNGRWLKHVMGAASPAPTAVGVAGFLHKWIVDPTHTAVEGRGLTVEVPLLSSGGGARSRYRGCKISEARLSIEAGGVMLADLSFLGKNVLSEASVPTTYVFTTQPKIAANQFGATPILNVVGATTTALRVRRFSLAVRSGVRHYDPTINDLERAEPIRSGPYEIEWEADAEGDTADVVVLASMLNNPRSTPAGFLPAVTLQLDGPVIAGQTDRYFIRFTMPRSSIDAGGDPVLPRLGEPAMLNLRGTASRADLGSDDPLPADTGPLVIQIQNKTSGADV